MKNYFVIVFALSFITSFTCGAEELYIRVQGAQPEIKSETEVAGLDEKGWMPLNSIDLRMENITSIDSRNGGIGRDGKVNIEPIIITRVPDMNSARLYQALLSGESWESVEIVRVEKGQGGRMMVLQKFELKMVLVSGIDTSGAATKKEPLMETLVLDFAAIQITSPQYDAAGRPSGPESKAVWSRVSNDMSLKVGTK